MGSRGFIGGDCAVCGSAGAACSTWEDRTAAAWATFCGGASCAADSVTAAETCSAETGFGFACTASPGVTGDCASWRTEGAFDGVAVPRVREDTFATRPKLSGAAEMLSEGSEPAGASVGTSSSEGLCALTSFEKREDELAKPLEETGMVSIGEETADGSGAGAGVEAGTSGKVLTAETRLGIGTAKVVSLVLPGIDAVAVVFPGAGTGFAGRTVPSKPLAGSFPRSPEARLWSDCAFELVNGSKSMTGRMAGRARKARTGFDPGLFLLEIFVDVAFADTTVFPGAIDGLVDGAATGTPV